MAHRDYKKMLEKLPTGFLAEQDSLKVIKIVVSEKAPYNLLSFICLKMELHWS